jgi:thioredoxin reductase (NADPH)
VTAVDLQQHPFRVWAGPEEYQARSLIICTGSSPRRLGVPGELELIGYGVSTCATCDGAFFRGQTIAVVGGGDSAAEEATFLTRFAEKVYLIHRRDRLRASPVMAERVLSNGKIEPVWNTVVTEILGSPAEGVTGVRLQHTQTGETSSLAVTGVFIAIGHLPNTELFRGQLELDEAGYIVADSRTHTNIPGVFAAGDVVDHWFMQAITAAGTGCAAALEAERFIAQLEGRAYPGKR